jgi:transcriptional regulator with XRE-family HTH domain
MMRLTRQRRRRSRSTRTRTYSFGGGSDGRCLQTVDKTRSTAILCTLIDSGDPPENIVAASDRPFYRAFGLRIAEARKAAGLTQTQLEQLGLAQQTLAHYEAGRLRVALALLSPLARTLGVSTEELIGEQTPPGKRGPVPKLQHQMQRIQRLPKSQQRFVMQMIDTVLAKQGR